MFVLIAALLVGIVNCDCPNNTELTFSKAAGFKPRLPYQPPLLYASTYGSSVTAACYNRCRKTPDCFGFVLVYATASCYRIGYDANDPKYGLVPDEGVSFFSKICLPLPQNCSNMAWGIETTLGYEFLGPHHTILSNVEDRWSCINECLLQAYRGEPCISANYYPATQSCTLSSHDRWLNPDMFVPSTQRSTEYIDNNCLQELDENICWQLPNYNTTSLRADAQFEGLDIEECRKRCESEAQFKCRAFSFLNKSVPTCILHSDTSIVNPGPLIYPALTPTIGGSYIEMISCVNLTVTCNKDAMTVILGSKNFKGILSVRGRSAVCSTPGKGYDTTSLVIPLPKGEENKCNINVAYSIGDVNRTLASTVVIVQYHELIQRSGDRIIKASCLLSESNEPEQKNITLGAGFAIQEPGVQSEITGSSGSNATSNAKAKMSLVDGRTGRAVQDVKLGDPLILRIELQKPYNISNVHVGHLVATSGDRLESLLLLDWNGCPPDPTIFPALSKTSENTLEAPFKSFRFQSTQILSLAVVLTFCKDLCPPADCGNGIISYGRKKREVPKFTELPLELTITLLVQDNTNSSSPILQASSFEWHRANPDGQVCTSFVTASIIALFWLLLQCSLLALCCCVLQKKKEEHADTISLSRDFQPPRHVTFIDEVENTSHNLRLSTPMKT